MTARLPRNGAAPMTGALKLANGTSAAPAMTFADDTTKGLYRDSSGVFRAVGLIGVTPVGGIIDYAGTTEPAGWLFCAGQSLLRASYPDLFTAIGTTYGAVDGTHFTLPDLRGRVSAGQDDMNGTSANRLTNANDGLNGDTLGAAGGGETQVLINDNLPPYTPAGTNGTSVVTVAGGDPLAPGLPGFASTGVGSGFGTIALSGTAAAQIFTGTAQGGTSVAFGVVQPTIILNKIIFAGV